MVARAGATLPNRVSFAVGPEAYLQSIPAMRGNLCQEIRLFLKASLSSIDVTSFSSALPKRQRDPLDWQMDWSAFANCPCLLENLSLNAMTAGTVCTAALYSTVFSELFRACTVFP